MGIFNEKGQAIYKDEALDEYYQFISSFINENFNLLSVGDHSIPLSGLNLAFYKVTDHAMIILHTKEGPVGQLLAFKSRMYNFGPQIEEISRKFTENMVSQIPKPRIKKISKTASAERIPVLNVDINKKKFPMDEAQVLHIIDGKKTISEICEEVTIPRLKINEILKKYQKKGWLKLKRVIGKRKTTKIKPKAVKVKKVVKVQKPKPKITKPTPAKTAAPKLRPKPKAVAIPFSGGNPTSGVTEKKTIPEFQPSGVELELSPEEEQGIYIFPIATQDTFRQKISKNEQKILKLCDGRNTVDDIVQVFSMDHIQLMQILHKLEKKGLVRLTQIIPDLTKTMIEEEPMVEVKQEVKV
jgi:hypothetical protein